MVRGGIRRFVDSLVRERITELEEALRATGHRPYRKNTTHWHEPNESGYCPGCAVLASEEPYQCHVCCPPGPPCPCDALPHGEDEFCVCGHGDAAPKESDA